MLKQKAGFGMRPVPEDMDLDLDLDTYYFGDDLEKFQKKV
jgi:hypothetical protein